MYQDTLDADALRQALAATSHKRQSEHMLLEGDEILKEVEASPVMQKLWESYRKKFSYASDIGWPDVMSAVWNLYGMAK